ncbi:RNA ligase domain, REL/Rln2 [Thauera sp. 28]|uniref:RNA ligase family protein n=1 Tax=Thauera sp. 28 TaxID=303682 RepID=UPI0002CFC7F2|nr:RNA ligase family protein [Thauera sp. 28]ENO94814.1 RNA ligase domain, REL/Rln2 [Thauera sp. 28]
MTDFFRFPHTPHLAWLGKGAPRDDKVLSRAEAAALLDGEVVVEEKLDGANLGISLAPDGGLRAQNRGQYLAPPFGGQFSRLPAWLAMHERGLLAVLQPALILFGEWCAARHSLHYDRLPDLWLLFDVYDRGAGRFWSVERRDALATAAGLRCVPRLAQGRVRLDQLERLVATERSRSADGPLEGVVVRQDGGDWCNARAKLVRAEFTQAIDGHWRSRRIEWNRCLEN